MQRGQALRSAARDAATARQVEARGAPGEDLWGRLLWRLLGRGLRWTLHMHVRVQHTRCLRGWSARVVGMLMATDKGAAAAMPESYIIEAQRGPSRPPVGQFANERMHLAITTVRRYQAGRSGAPPTMRDHEADQACTATAGAVPTASWTGHSYQACSIERPGPAPCGNWRGLRHGRRRASCRPTHAQSVGCRVPRTWASHDRQHMHAERDSAPFWLARGRPA